MEEQEQEQEREPTIEEIKIIANQKRPKKPSAYNDFIKQQMELLKGQDIKPKEKMKLATQEWHKQKEPQGAKEELPLSLPPPPKTFTRKKKSIKDAELLKEELIKTDEIKKTSNGEYDDLFNEVNVIKEMLINLKPKPRAKPKPKKVIKTLDLTITDNEINNIIKNEKEQQPKQDEKIKAFLDALLKRN